MRLNPHLAFNGQCEAAFEFYEKCLGGKIVVMMTFGDSPAAAQRRLSGVKRSSTRRSTWAKID